ncbi:MAG: T9SS type A sorting domain-containing protein [Bacteroidia bacterium]|nr:T9SS type A sorting domain-containing protein [Bacteroidia bacterium]
MKKLVFFAILLIFEAADSSYGQVIIDPVALIADEDTVTRFCFNNTKLMAGNNINDRYIIYYNDDTIFLNVNQAGTWTRKIAYTGDTINSTTLTFSSDTIWICWKEGKVQAQIKSSYSSDKGNSWSSVITVSPAGKVESPSIDASSNGKIHFAWSHQSQTDTTVYYNVYSNGSLLSSPVPLSNPTGHGQTPSVIAVGDTVLVAWKEGPLPTQVWFRSSFDGGLYWNPLSASPVTTLLPLTKDPNLGYAFDSATGTHYVYLAYDGQNLIYLQRSTDFGNSWSTPDTISSLNKWSQFAHIECNNDGFVGLSYEQRPVGTSLFDDTKKDVGFTYSVNWGNSHSFSTDTLAYTYNGFGSAYTAFNKINDADYYLAWLTHDTVSTRMKVFERRIHFSVPSGINSTSENRIPVIPFPNPSSGIFTIRSALQQPTTIELYTLSGQQVFPAKAVTPASLTIDISQQPKGIYFMKIITATQAVTHKILVE